MQLRSAFLQLPLCFDADRLAAEVTGFGPGDWRPHPQGHPGNFALPLVAADGDPGNDATKGPMRPTPHLARCAYLQQVLGALDTVIGRTRLMRLEGHAEATPHADTNYYWIERARVHVPVTTTADVRFECGDQAVHMAAGECWIFDTWRRHNVINPRASSRVHLVVDTIGSAAFARLLAAGRDPAADAAPAWTPQALAFRPGADTRLEFERVNHPVVMSPWELEANAQRVHAQLDAAAVAAFGAELAQACDELGAAWRALWAAHGDAASGWPGYAACLHDFDRHLARLERRGRLRNNVDPVEALRQFIVRAALNPDLAGASAAVGAGADALREQPRTSAARAGAAGTRPRAAQDPFAAPVFIVSPPRSGSSLLFETLAQSPDVATVGGESHQLIEGIAALDPRNRQHDSNRLVARDATPAVVAALVQRFRERLHDRERTPLDAVARPLRLLEKTPKNALRVPFLAEAFPGARFVYLYRDARETLSSMLDAWKSGRFVTYRELPSWDGPWSLLLTPGWRDWRGAGLAEVVARQWSTAVRILLDDLEALEPERWCVASYDRLVGDPQAEIERLCRFLDLRWDRSLSAPLPAARHTLTSPAPEKWRHNAAELEPVLELAVAQANRAHAVFARPPATRVRRPAPAAGAPPAATVAAVAGAPGAVTSAEATFASVHTQGVPLLLAQLGASLAVTTYQSGRLVLVRSDGGRLNTHLRGFRAPMGLARQGRRLALGTQREVLLFNDQPAVAVQLEPAGTHDACFVPLAAHVTGDVRVHEMAYVGEELWIVATRFSCLATLDAEHSFVPRWRPRFVSALDADDRCHLNGLAVDGGRVAWVTALGATDTAQGWREAKGTGGVLLDVASGEVVARGLCMPHSPRVHAGRVWLLESGKGTLATVDPADGRVETVATLPGFTRGLAFAGQYAFIGLSQVRESVFAGVPVAEREHERHCGVWIVDTTSGSSVGFLRFEGEVREIFDVQLLAGLRYPELLEPDHERVASSFVLPDAALADVAAAARAATGT